MFPTLRISYQVLLRVQTVLVIVWHPRVVVKGRSFFPVLSFTIASYPNAPADAFLQYRSWTQRYNAIILPLSRSPR